VAGPARLAADVSGEYRPVTPEEWDRLFAHVMWMEPKPQWRPRWGRLAVALAVSCGLWAAIIVPLIIWGPL